MRKVILAYADESQRVHGPVKKLRNDIAGHVEIIEPDSDALPAVSPAEWVTKNASKADFVVIFFAEIPIQSAVKLLVAVPLGEEQPVVASAGTPADRTSDNAISLTVDERAKLPDHPTILVAVFQSEDRDKLPPDLNTEPGACFDLSSSNGREALLCRLVHEPVDKRAIRKELLEDAAAGAFRLVIGVAMLLLGMYSKTDEILIPTLGLRVAQGVHYCIAAGVLVLLFTGMVALFRLAFYSLRSVMVIDRPLPGGRKVWQSIAMGCAAIFVTFVAFKYFPHPPQIKNLVDTQVRAWDQRLEESQYHDGGIREHHDQGVAQVWISSQALCGLLSSQPTWAMPAAKVRRVFTFIERARISPLELQPDARAELARQLTGSVKQADFTNLTQRFPTFAMAIDMIELEGGGMPLDAKVVDSIEQQKASLFKTTPSGEGWGYFEQWEWGVTEVAAWVALAEIQSLRANQPAIWQKTERDGVKLRIREVIQLIGKRQLPSEGGFSPIADTSNASLARTYSTMMSVWAMAEAVSPDLGIYDDAGVDALQLPMQRAIQWLELNATSNGWKVNPKNPAEQELFGLTAQTLCILGRVPARIGISTTAEAKFASVKRVLLDSAETWTKRSVSANDSIHDADRYLHSGDRVIEGSTILWYPWGVALMRSLSTDPALSTSERATAAKWLHQLNIRITDYGHWIALEGKSQFNYVPGEALIGCNWPMDVRNKVTP